MKRLNRCLIKREQYGLTVKDAIKLENKRIEKRNVEKYLAECMNRMFGDDSDQILNVRHRRSRKTIDGPIIEINKQEM